MPTATNRINPPITVPTISPTDEVVSCPTDGMVSSGFSSNERAGVGGGGFPLGPGVGSSGDGAAGGNSGGLPPYSEGYDRTVVGGAIGGAVGLPPYSQKYVGG